MKTAAVRTLKELFDAADALTGKSVSSAQEKTAAAVSDIDALAETLLAVKEAVAIQAPASHESEHEKIAMSLNRVQTASYIDALIKVDAFESQAREEGYSDAQIDEALSKTAAKALLNNLPAFVAVTGTAHKPTLMNMLPKHPEKRRSLTESLGRLPLTKSLGY